MTVKQGEQDFEASHIATLTSEEEKKKKILPLVFDASLL